MEAMHDTLRTLRTIQRGMLGSIVLCAVVAELLGSKARATNASLSYFFTTAAVAIVGAIFVIRRTLVLPSAESLLSHPEDSLTLNHWKSGYIATYALCEALALFGFVLRLTGSSFQQALTYYVGGFVLLFFFGPQRTATASHSSSV